MNNKIERQEKISKKTRCPWCGEILLRDYHTFRSRFDNTKKCRNCGGYSTPEDTLTDNLGWISMLMSALSLLYLERYKYGSVIYTAIFCFCYFIIFSFFLKYVPYKRIVGYKEKNIYVPKESLNEQILFYAHIKWNCSKWHIFKLWSSKLLIIIAVDKNNQPISHPICVRIRKCKTGYELTKIVRAFEFNNKTCRRFFVYWGNELVGEGTVISKFYL